MMGEFQTKLETSPERPKVNVSPDVIYNLLFDLGYPKLTMTAQTVGVGHKNIFEVRFRARSQRAKLILFKSFIV